MVEVQSLKVKYKEPILMFQNVNGTFKDISAQSEPPLVKIGLRAAWRWLIMTTTAISMC
jgi:hypothetical protein